MQQLHSLMVSATELCEYLNPYQLLKAGLQGTCSSVTVLKYITVSYYFPVIAQVVLVETQIQWEHGWQGGGGRQLFPSLFLFPIQYTHACTHTFSHAHTSRQTTGKGAMTVPVLGSAVDIRKVANEKQFIVSRFTDKRDTKKHFKYKIRK